MKRLPLLSEKLNESTQVDESVLADLWNHVVQLWNDTSHYVDSNGTSDLTKGEYFRIGVYTILGNLSWMYMAFKDELKKFFSKDKDKTNKVVELYKKFSKAKSEEELKAAVAEMGGSAAAAKFEKEVEKKSVDESKGGSTRITRANYKKPEDASESWMVDAWNHVVQLWNDTSHYVDANGTSDLTKGEYFRIGVYTILGNLAWMSAALKGSGLKTWIMKFPGKIKALIGLAKDFKKAKSVDDIRGAVKNAGGDIGKFEAEIEKKDASESHKFYGKMKAVNEASEGKKTYFLFGSHDAIAEYSSGEFEWDKHKNDVETFKFIEGKTKPQDLLEAFSGFEDWYEITEEDYENFQ